ncbi:helix-turn-helix domain-containing protein [Kitasatospora sp. NBC_01302]|uniref:helix-turn-helix domain-containing protein n=1 Tax=Kitasatospora sp. NBC_01302 TaxID=2903575 RepID=UPI002E13C549|nr:AraC family transcriptional regulator [Kitasatospora sp. NBC_01302]
MSRCTVSADDGGGQPTEHHRVVGGDDPGGDGAADPGLRVEVLVCDGPSGHGGDQVGDVADREGLRTGGRVHGAGVGLGGEQRLGRDGGDVGRVDEGLGSAAGGDGDHAADEGQVAVGDVLHHPGGADHAVGDARSGGEVGFDGLDVDPRWGGVGAVGAQAGDVADACGLCRAYRFSGDIGNGLLEAALAREQLRTGRLGLAGIARSVGYGSPYAFAAAFRRHHGEPPGAWRERESTREEELRPSGPRIH